jgi:uncharacterized protein
MIGLRRLVCCVATHSAVAVLACTSGSDSASSDQYAHLMAFDTARVRLVSGVDTTTLVAELAETADQHTMGLMERRALSADAGMLFLYSRVQPESSAFWMFRTRIPLDIAFIDSAGVIRTVQTMTPCTSVLAQGCPNYPAGAPYIAALEVNAGYFAEKKIRVGATYSFRTRPRAARDHDRPTDERQNAKRERFRFAQARANALISIY